MKLLQLSAAAFSLLLATASGALAQVPANDSCAAAIDLSSSFGLPVGTVTNTGPYDNTNATVHATDPTTGFECFGEPTGNAANPTIDNTLWFSFVGDGNLYFIETGQCDPAVPAADYIDDGDTQIALYTGTCGSLTPVVCNEDGPSATSSTYPAGLSFRPEAGVTYYMMVDGFSLNGAISRGQFCLLISRLPDITCTDSTVNPGTATANKTVLCEGEAVNFTSTGVGSPNVGDHFGVSWVITTVDLMGDFSALATAGNLIATYGITTPAPATSTRTFTNDGTLIGTGQVPYGTYYWTPVVFGLATLNPASASATFLSDVVLDPNCTYLGASLPVTVYPPNDPACLIGMEDGVNAAFSIGNLYPVPVTSDLNITLSSVENTTVTILVRDVLGRVVASQNRQAVAGENNYSINLATQTAGVYSVTVTDGTSIAVSKFVKQ